MIYRTMVDESTPELERMVETESTRPIEPVTFVATCQRDGHPTLKGRVHVVWTDQSGDVREAWASCLRGVSPAAGDRLLLSKPDNMTEPVVTGVVDGFAPNRQADPTETGPEIRLAPEEALRVCLSDGTPIVQVQATASGVEVRLLVSDADVDLPGKLRIRADDIELAARRGEVNLTASGDVKVAGEIVRLN